MTTRDPRSRSPLAEPGREGSRDPTQSLEIDLEAEPSHPSLAVGTSDASREDHTKVESPGARHKTPVPRSPTRPPPVPGRHPDDPDLRLGAVLGAYRLVELLGKGGMGYVYRAEHIKLEREVALKLLRGDYARRRDAVLRFFQEAKTVNLVRHRNIVDVTDFVELDDGTTFIIMELLSGQSLGKWARTGVDLPRAFAVLVQICDGLGAAHAVGVVHRDLKPDNVIVVPTSDGAELVKLLDFGVAKLVNRDDEDVGFQTAAGSVIGTPAYMSPEQAGGMVIDQRSDIYSLGAIMYELFCGQPMFRGRSFGEYVRKHLTEQPVPPRQTPNGAGMDERLEALILKCLAKDPNDRFSHILELRDGLLHLLGGIETQPPSYAALAHSTVRAAPNPLSQLPPHVLPLPAPGMVTTVPTPPSMPSQMSGMSSSLLYGQYSQAYTPEPAPAPTPWWVWFIGGAFAVGLGITGALWYAGRNDAIEPVQTKPALATPIETPAPPQLVELKFDSLPSGGVYADGRSAELCHTPCAYTFDLKDGERRTLVVRSDGYRDKAIDIDLRGTQHEFAVTLERFEPTIPTVSDSQAGSQAGSATDTATADKPDATDDPGKKTGGKKAGGKKTGGKSTDTTDKTDKTADKTADKTDKTTTPPPDKKLDDGLEKPDPRKGDDKIDPADTHDPFHRHP